MKSLHHGGSERAVATATKELTQREPMLSEKDVLEIIGHRIRALRTKQNISQQALANIATISSDQLWRIERGILKTGVQTLYKIAWGLDVNLCDLIDV